MTRRLSEDEMKRGCEMYEAGASSAVVAGALAVQRSRVIEMLKGRGVMLRGISVFPRLYSCNDGFFLSVDCEVKAYWLGFLAGDGNVSGNTVRLKLQRRDRGHLARFLVDLISTHPIRDRVANVRGMVNGAYAMSMVAVTSPSMVEGLAAYGVIPNKIRTMPFPSLRADLIRHYVRGYVDANGGLYYWPGKQGAHWEFGVLSNRGWCVGAQATLMAACGLRVTNLRASAVHASGIEVFTLRWGGRLQVSRIFHYLYDGATSWLPRKRDRIEPWIKAGEAQHG